jgi:tetratricopeptide (TPR) repeat protein
MGGQGKTALARELHRLLTDKVEPSYRHLRHAMLDLHAKPKTDPDRLMVWIRNGFSEAGVSFPAFDLAFAIMWERTRGDEPLPMFENPWLSRMSEGATEAIQDMVQVTRELIDETVQTIPILGFLLRRGARWSIDRAKSTWLEHTRPQLEELYRDGLLIADHEMSALMPWMLAQDLNRHLLDHPDERFVLFLDEYERVTEGAGTGARWRENPFDDRMRSFVAETDGLLACFFSRERLAWEKDPEWHAILADHQHLLGGLDTCDAERWLEQVPVENGALRAAMIEGARATPEGQAPIYPLMLDLQIAHWRNLGMRATPVDFHVSAVSFEGRRRELVTRLMRDYSNALQQVLPHLMLVENFDRKVFDHIVHAFNISLSLEVFDQIARLSIMSKNENGWLTPHRAVADAIVQETEEDARNVSQELLITHFAERAKPKLPRDVTDETLVCLREGARLRLAKGVDGYVSWLDDVEHTIFQASQTSFSETLWREAVDATVGAYGDAHADTGTSYNNFASLLRRKGQYDEAEPLFRKALEIRRAALGETHAKTAQSYNSLAILLRAKGQYDEAEPLSRKALEIRRAALSETHVDTGTSYNSLAGLLQTKGQYDEAEPLFRKALEIRRAALGETHAETAQSYNSLAGLLQTKGQYDEAEPLSRKALEISRAALGETHAGTGASYNSLAILLQTKGQYDEAEPLFRKALEIRRAALGETHAGTGASYNSLATLLQTKGQYDEAEPLFRKALEIRRAALGETHAGTKVTVRDLGCNLKALGYDNEARSLFEKIANRNSACPCGSGVRFKRCCGSY